VRRYDGAGVAPGGVEAGVDCTVGAFGLRVWIVGAWIGRILLRDGGQVGDGVGERVCASEGEDQATWGRWVGERDVAA